MSSEKFFSRSHCTNQSHISGKLHTPTPCSSLTAVWCNSAIRLTSQSPSALLSVDLLSSISYRSQFFLFQCSSTGIGTPQLLFVLHWMNCCFTVSFRTAQPTPPFSCFFRSMGAPQSLEALHSLDLPIFFFIQRLSITFWIFLLSTPRFLSGDSLFYSVLPIWCSSSLHTTPYLALLFPW